MLKMIVPYGATDLALLRDYASYTMDSNEVRKLQLIGFIVTLTCLLVSTVRGDTAAWGGEVEESIDDIQGRSLKWTV